MALPPSVQSGQSNSPQYSQPTQFENLGYHFDDFQTNIIGSTNPDTVINYNIDGQTRTPNFTFPTDLPKYHFTLIQNDWQTARRNLKFEAMYKFPLPMGLTDEHEVKYDANFNFLNLSSRLRGAVSSLTGLTLNNIKSVTMDVPEFRTYQFTWKLSPKNFQEAQTIQRMITAIKIAMHPRGGFDSGTQADKLVLIFPKIFTMYFNPNIRYLYKFKPAVISAIKVDYQGGQPVPSFYASPNAPSESPPESILLTLGFIELEYWLNSDFRVLNGLPTNDPFDAFNFYQYAEEPHTPIIPPINR
jgi:hypothetical protein